MFKEISTAAMRNMFQQGTFCKWRARAYCIGEARFDFRPDLYDVGISLFLTPPTRPNQLNKDVVYKVGQPIPKVDIKTRALLNHPILLIRHAKTGERIQVQFKDIQNILFNKNSIIIRVYPDRWLKEIIIDKVHDEGTSEDRAKTYYAFRKKYGNKRRPNQSTENISSKVKLTYEDVLARATDTMRNPYRVNANPFADNITTIM